MSIQAVAWALEQDDVPARPKLVLVAIANHANHVDGYCWLKVETIAREAACTPRAVYNFVGDLVRNGFIRKALRRDDHGKQRATDYWIILDRDDKPWDSTRHLEADEPESEASEIASSDDDQTISSMPPEPRAAGESDDPPEPRAAGEPAKIPALSCGPVASTFRRQDSLASEPSESKPQESSARARVLKSTLRHYRPPPPQPVGEVFDNSKQFFAYEGTRAYEDWAKVKARENGIRNWHLTTRKLVDGQWRSGWYFPSLFPPSSTGPPQELSDEDAKAFTGT